MFFDATHSKAKLHGRVISRAVVIATGIRAIGHREVLGRAVSDSEAETFWTEFLRDLPVRGLAGVQLVVSDAHRGLTAALAATRQRSVWQRSSVNLGCGGMVPTVHLHRRGGGK